MSNKYIVVDNYENYGLIGEGLTLSEAEDKVEEWKKETDGECDCEILIDVWSEKREYVKSLENHLDIIKAINKNVKSLEYRGDYKSPVEYVIIRKENGTVIKVNVTMDSTYAILNAIIRAIK